MMKIAHFVERFPVAGNDYIYNQVFNNANINSLLIAEWLVNRRNSFNINPFYHKKYSRFSFFNRLNNKLNDGVFNRLYINKLNSYVQKVLKDNQISIIHAHFGIEGYKLIELRKKLDIQLVVSFYGVDASYCLKHPRWLARFKPMFKFADRLIVLCDEAKKRLTELDCPADKICVWNIGIDLDKFPYRDRRPRGGKFKFLTAARFVEKKGYPVLLKAFSILSKKRNDIRLTALGYGPLKMSIEQMVIDLGLKEIVTLIDTSRIEDFNQFYNQFLSSHDIYVQSSIVAENGDDEAGPALTSVCAQSAGLPVVTTPFTGASRSILDNKTGLVAKNDSSEALAEKISYLIDNSHLWNKLGEAGSNFVRENFSLARQIKALEDIYISLWRA